MNWNRANRATGRVARAAVALLACAVMLGACGRETEETPTPLPATGEAPILDLTPDAITPAAPAPAATIESVSSPAAASPVSGDPTVGQLADRIAAAWSGVTSYRTTFNSFVTAPIASPVPVGGASPVAGGTARIVVDEVNLPDQRRRTETVGGEVVSEIVLVEGVVYLRGITPDGMEGTPVADPDAWVTLDANLPADSPYRAIYDEITAAPAPPYSALSQDERSRTAHPVGEITVGDRACTAYRVADTSIIGERLDVVIALDANDLPCSIETRASGTGATIGTTVFEFNLPLSIAPPR